ncbi:MAG: iron-sulfur cluster assembly protein [Candidatus Aenigmarchaeota archaeon]|nr:iron-sulfur cluster assembly protein [Candidatus Aenigmarchaeota archaeon]
MSREEVLNILRKIKDPHLGENIVDANMVKDLEINDKLVKFKLIAPAIGCVGCPAVQIMVEEIKEELNKHGYKSDIEVVFE